MDLLLFVGRMDFFISLFKYFHLFLLFHNLSLYRRLFLYIIDQLDIDFRIAINAQLLQALVTLHHLASIDQVKSTVRYLNMFLKPRTNSVDDILDFSLPMQLHSHLNRTVYMLERVMLEDNLHSDYIWIILLLRIN